MTTIALKISNRKAKAKQRLNPKYKELEKSRRDGAKEWAATLKRRGTKEGWARHLIPGIKYRAKNKGIEFNLTWIDIKIPDYCPALGIKLVLADCPENRGQLNPNRPSVDRIDNDKGYTADNICVISNRANILKKDASFDEIKGIYNYMIRGLPLPQ